MGQLLIRNLDEATKEGLRARAKLHGSSMEEESRIILRSAIHQDAQDGGKLGSWFAAQSALYGITREDMAQVEANIAELRSQPWPEISFGEE